MSEKHQHICPRNCYDTCSLISTTVDGRLVSVEGNPAHDYTRGRVCPKIMNDVAKVYSPARIRYPMRQKHRFQGDWERIGWEEALTMIAGTVLALKEKYGSTLPLALNKYSGNFGFLHNAMEWLFTGIGPTTRAVGSPCWSAGVEAQAFDFGRFVCSDPLEMAQARLIWLWGVNPAWTAVHQMPIIFEAMDRGAKVVCFDTYFSATAARSHRFVQVRPGTDGLLALAMGKVLVEENLVDPELENYSLGLPEFTSYLKSEIDLTQAAALTGVGAETIRELALSYGQTHPACIWAGFGLQRYVNGGQTLRAIDALGALAGHIGERGGGVNYGHFETWNVPGFPPPEGQPPDRLLDMNRFAEEALACGEPPLKMLWLAGRNPLSQDADLELWRKLVGQLELVIVSDLFLTKSAEAADLFLPVTTHYEHWDLNAGYWHYWVGVNEPAISPLGEAKSDLEIAWDLARRLNELEPGSCAFPGRGSEKETVFSLMTPDMLTLLGLNKPEDILAGPVRARLPAVAWSERKFATPSGRFEFFSDRAAAAGLPALPVYIPALNPPGEAPLRLLTPHHASSINSQSYLDEAKDYYELHVNPKVLQEYEFRENEEAEIYNDSGRLPVKLRVDPTIPEGLAIIYPQDSGSGHPGLNVLLKSRGTDMGKLATGAPGLALNETFVNLRKPLSKGA
ncbi:dimethyl sulfoxide reductase DmsA precursor [Peptococcaceae bacterium CEB3]|nr:dimethyl sulfoxide reductase DmsA precursor [Peptococcaceae bacterium CEB3]